MGAIDWDRPLFDSLIPLPDGTSYNTYLIEGSEKTVPLDTVDPSMLDVLRFQLREVVKVDFIVVHHAEQDHSGCLPALLELYPSAVVLSSNKGKGMLVDLLQIPEERITTVEDGLLCNRPGTRLRSGKRYYAEITMPFRSIIQKNLDKVEDYAVDLNAPSHGPIYGEPEFVIDAYRD